MEFDGGEEVHELPANLEVVKNVKMFFLHHMIKMGSSDPTNVI